MERVERFVLVDDNDLDNQYHSIVLARAGFSGERVVLESGIELLAYLQADEGVKATVILLDINMPMLSGFETVERLAGLALLNERTRIYILSSSDAPSDREQAIRQPRIQGYLIKPLRLEDVARLMTDPQDPNNLSGQQTLDL